jgi:hypothetical protein
MYRVQDLDKSVEEYREKGFEVEYGREKNPINALIFFSEGPYIELIAGTKMPPLIKGILRFFGQGKLVDRLDFWDAHPVGKPCGLGLENYRNDLNIEGAILKKYGYSCFQVNTRRNDTKGRKLRFKVGYPNDLQIPFYMTYFNIDPKPKNFVHPNGAVRINYVSFGVREELFPLMRELCDDEILEICAGNGIQEIKFEYMAGYENFKKI